MERREGRLAGQDLMPGAVLQIEDIDAAGLVRQGIVADGDAAAGGVAVGLLAVDVVGGPLIAAQQVDFGAAFGIRLDERPRRSWGS